MKLFGGDNNTFVQVGLVVLMGLACKNAILIVEFARELEFQGKGIVEAALEACRLRLRPIVMTSVAFIAGTVPLVLSRGSLRCGCLTKSEDRENDGTSHWFRLTAGTSEKRRTSTTNPASKGDLLSFLQARANGCGRFKSTTGVMTTFSGRRHRAVPRTHPTPKPVATRLRIVASSSPS